MRKKDISDAIGNINDLYIEEAADFQRKKKRTGKSSILQKSVAAAASFILVFILSVSTLVAADFSPAAPLPSGRDMQCGTKHHSRMLSCRQRQPNEILSWGRPPFFSILKRKQENVNQSKAVICLYEDPTWGG